MGIQCETCFGTEFELRDGAYFCKECLTESLQHGMETVVNEDTMGDFGSMGGNRSRSVSLKKRKRKQDGGFYTTFTTSDAFTYIIKGWVDQADLLGIGGDSLKLLVHHLYADYLSRTGRAFMKKKRVPHFGPRPAFRDLQVRLNGRKKILTLSKFAAMRKKRQKTFSLDDTDEPDIHADTREASRKRKKRRRDYLKTLSNSSNKSDEESSALDTSVCSSEVEDSEFFGESDIVLDRLLAGVLPIKSAKGKYYQDTKMKIYHLTLPVLFSIFSLGLVLHEDSSVTVSDIIHFVECDSISYYEAIVHIPSVMKLCGREDRIRYLRYRHLTPLTCKLLKTKMYDMAVFLGFGKVDFGGIFRLKENSLVDRYIQEFCLPKKLVESIKIGFKHMDLLHKFFFIFPNQSSGENWMIPDASVRLCGIILVILKFVYGLDDVSEFHISSTNAKYNKINPSTEKKFVFDEWMRLSRWRLFLFRRYSPIFHLKFRSFFPNTRLTHEAYIEDLRLMEESYTRRETNRASKKEYRAKFDELANYVEGLYGENLPVRAPFVLGTSLNPMKTFTEYVLDNSLSPIDKEDPISESAKLKLRKLLEMRSHRLGMTSTLGGPDSKNIELDVDHFQRERPFKNEQIYSTIDLTSSLKFCSSFEPKGYIFDKRVYWRLDAQSHLSYRGHSMSQKVQSDEEEDKLLSKLPETYKWLLQYFASYIGADTYSLHAEVSFIEKCILRQNPDFFGKTLI